MSVTLDEIAVESRNRVIVGLTREEIDERRTYLGASDANIVLSGDEEKILELWKVKTGLADPEDLSDVLPVQLGSFTEKFNLFWASKQLGITIRPPDAAQYQHKRRRFLRARPDGVTKFEDLKTIVDAKHVNPFYYDGDKTLAKYSPQLAVQMACLDADQALLSILVGTLKWDYRVIKRDALYEKRVLDACMRFWAAVEAKEPPVDIPVVPAAVPPQLMRSVDMTTNNEWAAFEQAYIGNEKEAQVFEKAKASLKKLIESDVKTAAGSVLTARRDAKGAIRFYRTKA